MIQKLLGKGYRFLLQQINVVRDWHQFKTKIIRNNNLKDYYILFSHNADGGGGAPVVLFEYARYLVSINENVILCVGKGGSLIQKGKNEGINCFQMGCLYKKYISKLPQLTVNGIIICTLVCYPYVSELQKYYKNKIIWWTHEEDKLLYKYEKYIPRNGYNNVTIMCGSERIKKSLNIIRPDLKLGVLYYGCRDQLIEHREEFERKKEMRNHDENYNIHIIGRICERKNQLQVVEAICNLPPEVKNNIYLNFVTASWENEYKKKLDEKIKEYLNIRIYGPVPSELLYKVYLDTDLLICSSIDDPLPVVVTNAMMYGCDYIISSGTGQSVLIENEIDGYVYDVNSTEQLTNLIMKCYKKSNACLGENARKLYLSHFSLEHMHSTILNILKT